MRETLELHPTDRSSSVSLELTLLGFFQGLTLKIRMSKRVVRAYYPKAICNYKEFDSSEKPGRWELDGNRNQLPLSRYHAVCWRKTVARSSIFIVSMSLTNYSSGK